MNSTNASDRVIIRPWPKVIFLYPTLVCALAGWIMSFITQKEGQPGNAMMGAIFCGVFFANLLVFAFDFSRIKSITMVVAIIALAAIGLWANTAYGIMEPIRDVIGKVDIRMNTQFYGFVSTFFCFMFLLVFINTRFNYYEINRNEILHHHGYLGDIQRTPTTAMRMQKEIYDLLEYLLLRSGRLIFYPSTVREALVIDNVVNISVVEDKIKHLLSSVSVAIRAPEGVGLDSVDM
ncbi:MAG: hypothetical protein ACE5F1_12285 [Planctomycetota bacterium]